jgi:hypothetical protein
MCQYHAPVAPAASAAVKAAAIAALTLQHRLRLPAKLVLATASCCSIRIIVLSMWSSRASRRSMRASLMTGQPINSSIKAAPGPNAGTKQRGSCDHRGDEILPAAASEVPRLGYELALLAVYLAVSATARSMRLICSRRVWLCAVGHCRHPSGATRSAKRDRISSNLGSIPSSMNRMPASASLA